MIFKLKEYLSAAKDFEVRATKVDKESKRKIVQMCSSCNIHKIKKDSEDDIKRLREDFFSKFPDIESSEEYVTNYLLQNNFQRLPKKGILNKIKYFGSTYNPKRKTYESSDGEILFGVSTERPYYWGKYQMVLRQNKEWHKDFYALEKLVEVCEK